MTGNPLKICLQLKPGIEPEQELAFELERALVARGHKVHLDRQRTLGLGWAQKVEEHLRQADLVIPLLSARSVQSEMLAYEVEMADAVASQQDGWPRIVPVRLNVQGVLPAPFDGFLREHEFVFDESLGRHRSRQIHWRSPADDAAVLAELDRRITEAVDARATKVPEAAARRSVPLETVGGAVPLDSQFYIERPTDGEFRTAVQHRDSLILLKGARQMGKTSLLARGLQTAREAGCHVILTDLQKLPAAAFGSVREFLMALSEMAARQLQLDVVWQRRWKNERAPNVNFEDFWRRDVLGSVPRPTVWAIDEFDRLFTADFGTDVCGLLRSWHNERALDPTGPWRELSIAIAYATEVHLFIRDLNQSPFNVGTRLSLEDFTLPQVGELNRRHGEPLTGDAALQRLHRLVGGQPYLLRAAFRELADKRLSLEQLEGSAAEESGIFGDHLGRILVAVSRDAELTTAVRQLLRGERCSQMDFFRLRSAGVIGGTDATTARFRCELYATFLRRHLG